MLNFVPIYILAFIISFGIAIPVCRGIIPPLRKRAAQPIYAGGPTWHSSKSGTPTLGGLAFIISVLCGALLCSAVLLFLELDETCLSVISVICFALLNSLVGIVDDLTKLLRKQNAGLNPLQKLFFQTIIAVLFLFVRHKLLGYSTEIPFFDHTLDLGFLYYPITVFIMLGIVNCANLTDGVDGLASGVFAAMSTCIFLISAYSFPDAAIISALGAGGVLAFLIFNVNPAKIFMGDTGSLFLGGIAAAVVFCFSNPLLSILFGGVYVIEGISVVLQVVSYKSRKKRLFLMSPIHHHLEKIGWNESKICLVAVMVTLSLSIMAFLLI